MKWKILIPEMIKISKSNILCLYFALCTLTPVYDCTENRDFLSITYRSQTEGTEKSTVSTTTCNAAITTICDLNISVPIQQSRFALSRKNVTRIVLCQVCVMHCARAAVES